MKFMISCKHSLVELQKADEIRVNYQDRKRLADFVTDEWQCKQDVYIYIPRDQLVDWNELQVYKEVLNIIVGVEDLGLIQEVKDRGYQVFWSYPISSYWELRGVLDLGVNQVLLDAPLYFDLPNVKKICGNVEIRLQVNKCVNGYMKRRNGVCGTYVRPEDVDTYAQYVNHMEFITDSLEKEEALLRVYRSKVWPGNLNILLDYLNENVDNRGLPEDFGKIRISCGQKCQGVRDCHYCENAMKVVTAVKKNWQYLNETYGPIIKPEDSLS